jgi:hypothetical protein
MSKAAAGIQRSGARTCSARRDPRARVALGAGLVAVVALVAAQTARTSAGQAATLPVDHYACYSAQLTGGKHPQVTLKNQFGSGSALVGAPTAVCAPADKDGSGIRNKVAHLTCYAVSQAKGWTTNHKVAITNQFGTQQMTVVVNPPQTLCVPSAKSTTPGVAPPGVPTNLDHYLCYLVDPGQFTPRSVKVADQFGTSGDTVVSAKSLCVPTSKNGSPFVQAKVHLLCYLVKSGSHGKAVSLKNQFGVLTGSLGQRFRLCVPSLKKVLS